ncbi:hypothetical protein TUM4438_45620 [Shewanella sairae]|uniref:Uncharacterized protein n=1 Tax=Shewanella sairae TaxID=190310 RepID=A0ABQ4PST9_9GAMM|nr:hypothetical protein [Shewanella sairae]MCL1129819.1 hypothetical protein [Shewanella sairae]GIU52572.1 hypothetical protein TUM4438_45620 [Shewanella sairae]
MSRRSIDTKCLQQLEALGLPIQVDVIDDNNALVTSAVIRIDGTVMDLATSTIYNHPSHLRQLLVKKETGTYRYFVYKGKTLDEHKVGRAHL